MEEELSESVITNLTEMELDPFWNPGEGATDSDAFESFEDDISTFYFMFSIIAVFILSILMITLHCFFIYTFCNFKQLRTRPNLYILNCSVIDCFTQVQRIIFFFIVPVSEVYIPELFCLQIETEHLVLCMYFFFALVPAVDWFLCTIKPQLFSSVLEKYWKIAFALAYTIFFIILAMKTSYCLSFDENSYWFMTDLSLVRTAAYIITFLCLIALNVSVKVFDWDDSNNGRIFALYTANAMIFPFVPEFIIHTLLNLFSLHITLEIILLYLNAIPVVIVNGHFAIVLYVYKKHNNAFQMIVANCFERSAEYYDIEHLVEDSENHDDGMRNSCSTTNNQELVL